MAGQLEAFIVPKDENQQEGIGLLIRSGDITEDPDGELVPGCLLSRAQALLLAYKLGELAQKLKQE